MNRFFSGWAVLLALTAATACGDDPVSQRLEEADPGAGRTVAMSHDVSQGVSGRRYIAVLDDCDPTDPGWAPTGGCALRRGDVTEAEFIAELTSPLSSAVIGHQAWRNEPSYLEIEADKSVRVKNEGGRVHTLTRVANFGGGRVPPLNIGLLPAPECQPGAGAVNLMPGETQEITGLTVGVHRFQCCIHPWMRALISVEAGEHEGH